MEGYERLITGIDGMALCRGVGFLRVDCYPVAMACRAQALKLKGDTADLLRQVRALNNELCSATSKASTPIAPHWHTQTYTYIRARCSYSPCALV